MPSLWPRILRAFRPPWRIVRRKDGGMWIESATGRVLLLYVYPRLNQNTDYKSPTEDEALEIVRAIARLSKRRHRPMPDYWVPKAKPPPRKYWPLV